MAKKRNKTMNEELWKKMLTKYRTDPDFKKVIIEASFASPAKQRRLITAYLEKKENG